MATVALVPAEAAAAVAAVTAIDSAAAAVTSTVPAATVAVTDVAVTVAVTVAVATGAVTVVITIEDLGGRGKDLASNLGRHNHNLCTTSAAVATAFVMAAMAVPIASAATSVA